MTRALYLCLAALCACSFGDKSPDSAGGPSSDSGSDTQSDSGPEPDCDDPVPWFYDADGDGYGDDATRLDECEAPAGYVAAGGDCDDIDPVVSPAADERCDGLDNDCDGTVDADAIDAPVWYPDTDEDGYGTETGAITACTAPDGHVATAGDCDDAASSVYPGATEYCDGVDDDCDGEIDEDSEDAGTWYPDADGDGYGTTEGAVIDCGAPIGYVEVDGDCDDGASDVYPGAIEYCDWIDQDCDDEIDEDSEDAGTWYPDVDGDGFGATEGAVITCVAPTGYVEVDGDCDDVASGVHPGAVEHCDGVDEDCDGDTDEDVAELGKWYPDLDGDGHGDPEGLVEACTAPEGYLADATDCDDSEALAWTDADEVCDGVDNDCDGETDPPEIVLGSAPECFAYSCREIGATLTEPTSGMYWVLMEELGLVEVWCSFDSETVWAD